jgi:AbiV family abortive infection protein
LLTEASLLQEHGHYARAYFLAVACIEEAGKALLAFDAQNRNLYDPAVCSKLKASMESHAQKINYAIFMWAMSEHDPREALHVALDLMFHLKNGREPSMYSDLRPNPDRARTPREVVRSTAAGDCIRLAGDTLNYAHRHVRERTPLKVTTAQDRLFTMKSAKFQQMLNTEDFWWYFISRMEAGQQDIAEAVIGYERDHIKMGRLFRSPE